MTFIHRRIYFNAKSWRYIDIDATLSQRCVPAGLFFKVGITRLKTIFECQFYIM